MKKLVIFDLDGVIFDSKENMRLSWNDVNRKLNLGIKFNDYFSKIGKPFETILYELKVNKKNIPKAKKFTDIVQLITLIKLKFTPQGFLQLGCLKKKIIKWLLLLQKKNIESKNY